MNRTYDDFLCRLKEQRKQLGLSQEQMAQRVHKTQSNYSKVELGLQRLSYEELKYLSESGIDIYYIFTGYRGSGKYLDFFERKTYAEICSYCYSFIEKPFDESKMKNVMEECLQFNDVQQANKTLFFRKDGIILALDREEILYSESIQHIMYIHTTKEDTLSIPYITVKKLLEDLNSSEFMQCSRNVIVNKKYIYNVDTVNRIIELKNGERVEIGITYKKKIKENYLVK